MARHHIRFRQPGLDPRKQIKASSFVDVGIRQEVLAPLAQLDDNPIQHASEDAKVAQKETITGLEVDLPRNTNAPAMKLKAGGTRQD